MRFIPVRCVVILSYMGLRADVGMLLLRLASYSERRVAAEQASEKMVDRQLRHFENSQDALRLLPAGLRVHASVHCPFTLASRDRFLGDQGGA